MKISSPTEEVATTDVAPVLLSTTQAAERLGCDRSTVTRKAKKGELQFAVKVPGRRGSYLFDEAVITATAAPGRTA